jgi:hypothetical protein
MIPNMHLIGQVLSSLFKITRLYYKDLSINLVGSFQVIQNLNCIYMVLFSMLLIDKFHLSFSKIFHASQNIKEKTSFFILKYKRKNINIYTFKNIVLSLSHLFHNQQPIKIIFTFSIIMFK